MVKIRILVLPNHIRTASRRVAEYLKRASYDTLFLNFSRSIESYVRELAEGAPYNYMLERIKELKLIPEPFKIWEYGAEPILKTLRGILHKKPGLQIYCYGDPSFSLISAETSERVTMMIFRACSTEKINANEWKEVAESVLKFGEKAIEKEINYILKNIKEGEEIICIAGFNGKHLKRLLKNEGYDVSLTYMYVPYYFTPLEILIGEMQRAAAKGFSISLERVKELAKYQIEFVREYVILNEDYEKAYRKWVHDKHLNLF